MKPLSLAFTPVLFGVLATAAWGSVALPAAVGSAICMSDNPVTTVSDPSACQLGGGSVRASVTTAPFVDVVSHAGSAAGVASFDAIGSLTYSFEVVGGSAGDHVPLLVATILASAADPSTFGAAGIVVTSPIGFVQERVCAGVGCSLASSFSGTLDVETVSGQAGMVQIVTQAENTFLIGGIVDASADPFIFIDPSFPGAGNYSVLVSDGVGNGLAPVPLPPLPAPASFVLLGVGLAALACGRRSPSQLSQRQI
jgi:hypothetical protein